MLKRCFTLIIVITSQYLIGCEHQKAYELPGKAEIGTDYKFQWTQIEGTQSLRVSLKNLREEPLCFDNSYWPDQNGDMHYAEDMLEIVVDGKVYKFIDENLGYPSGVFDSHLAANGELNAIVPVSNFVVPDESKGLPIEDLKYNNTIYFCDPE